MFEFAAVAAATFLFWSLVSSAHGLHEVEAGIVMASGGVLPFRAELVLPALDLAFEQVERDYGIRFNTYRRLHPGPCNAVLATGAVADLYYQVSALCTCMNSTACRDA